MNWRKFAFIAQKNNLDTLYSAMIANDPVLGDNFEIKYTVDNQVQLNFIENNQADLLGFLRKELHNWLIHLTLVEKEIPKEQMFTSKEKYEDMATRNPKLSELQKRFNLDIEY